MVHWPDVWHWLSAAAPVAPAVYGAVTVGSLLLIRLLTKFAFAQARERVDLEVKVAGEKFDEIVSRCTEIQERSLAALRSDLERAGAEIKQLNARIATIEDENRNLRAERKLLDLRIYDLERENRTLLGRVELLEGRLRDHNIAFPPAGSKANEVGAP